MKEDVRSSILNEFRSEIIPLAGKKDRENIDFGLQCNGYAFENGGWKFVPGNTNPLAREFRGQKVSFFGPGGYDSFFEDRYIHPREFSHIFEQAEIAEIIGRYRETDTNLGERLSFIIGGIIRHLNSRSYTTSEISRSVKFAARMMMLGEDKSVEAIASAIAMYIISGGSVDNDRNFAGRVYRMGEAVASDPITPKETRDLGLSQVARLRTYASAIKGESHLPLPDISKFLAPFIEFPTVGAEFHFPLEIAQYDRTLWKRLALLNMSQYQKGSYVQLSRNDRDVIEVRMNPSIYPTATSDWTWLTRVLPELNRAYFWITVNRPQNNFNWRTDRILIDQLRALGLLTYAGLFKGIPDQSKREEVNFGEVYLGQTVRLHRGKWKFNGMWGGGEGDYGQLSIYAGFGETFQRLVYYLSMALANPGILNSAKEDLQGIKTLHDAFAKDQSQRRFVFTTIQNRIETDERLRKTMEAGRQIIQLLNPGQ